MDVFKFTNPNEPTKMEQGVIINDIRSKMWVERYTEAGEFTFTSPLSSRLKDILPIGSFVSHIDTREIMIVENHEINEDTGSDPDIVITGRSFETIAEQMVTGAAGDYYNPPGTDPTDLGQFVNAVSHGPSIGFGWIPDLINSQIQSPAAYLPYQIPYINAFNTPELDADVLDRAIELKFGSVYSCLLEALNYYGFGIRVYRPGTDPFHGPGSGYPADYMLTNTSLVIHQGIDRTNEDLFSYVNGDLISSDYLWSNKNLKNAAIVMGKWVGVEVTTGALHYDRRVLFVDGSDIDQDFESTPTGSDLTTVLANMTSLGQGSLNVHNNIALIKADVLKQGARSRYRIDFDIGDFVKVSGDFDEGSVMQITEYVEIDDETGSYGYPTLALAE